MTLFVDSSALVVRYVEGPQRARVLEVMGEDDVWCASAMTRTEAMLVLQRLAATPRQADRLWRALLTDWDAFHVIPVDERCLSTAADVGANFGLRLAHAVQLAAADRLPRPARFLTLDDDQIAPAVALDLEVVAWDG